MLISDYKERKLLDFDILNIARIIMYSKLILHIPHSSTLFPDDEMKLWDNQLLLKKEINRWTDFYTDYMFAPHEKYSDNEVEVIKFSYSRFYCDVERLINDKLSEVGQGIAYTRTLNGANRDLTNDKFKEIIKLYNVHHLSLANAIVPNSLLIDCHSFPEDHSDIDICIGFNDDTTRPPQNIIDLIVNLFKSESLRVGINKPYSNSICANTTVRYNTIMIELNKRLYMHLNGSKNEELILKWNTLFNKMYQILLQN